MNSYESSDFQTSNKTVFLEQGARQTSLNSILVESKQIQKNDDQAQSDGRNSALTIRSNRMNLRKNLRNSIQIPKTSFSVAENNEELTASSVTEITHPNKQQPLPARNIRRPCSIKILQNSTEPKLEEETHSQIQNRAFDSLYATCEKIGQGVHSSVYRCINKKTQQVYAVKKLKNVDEETARKLKRVFQLMRFLDHPNLLKYHEFFCDSQAQKVQIVMELCQYSDLRQEIIKRTSSKSAFSALEIKGICLGVCESLHYLHTEGICHRDIKPENILYCPSTGGIKLIDFDICGAKSETEKKFDLWTNTGTTCYRAPETFKIGYSEKADIWSLGIVLYELQHLCLPFESQYENCLIKKIQTEEPKHSSRSRILGHLLQGCLRKEGKDRFSASRLISVISQSSQKDFEPRREALTSTPVEREVVRAGTIYKGVFQQ